MGKQVSNQPIICIIQYLLSEMENVGYSNNTISLSLKVFKRLEALAIRRNNVYFDDDLALEFINDTSNKKTGKYCDSRFRLHRRCIYQIKSFIENGSVNWSTSSAPPKKTTFRNERDDHLINIFTQEMNSMGYSKNTIDGYRRIVVYFLQYCEKIGCDQLHKALPVDVVSFLDELCKTRYQVTSLYAHLPGLKLFFSKNMGTEHLVNAIPSSLHRKIEVIPVLTMDEYQKVLGILSSGSLPSRDVAICWLALETGLRAVDLYNMKLTDLDWKNDCIQIVQKKTSKPLVLPLRSTFGNPLVRYILEDRPKSSSPNVFLSKKAPHRPLESHSAYQKIICNIFIKAGISKHAKGYGTRFTRHNAASYMLRKGIPLHEISAALGHANPNSVSIYITTDDCTMAECTLPLPSSINKEGTHEF